MAETPTPIVTPDLIRGPAPLCKNCAFLMAFVPRQPARCHRPVTLKFNLVEGEHTTPGSFNPHDERNSERTLWGRQKCSPTGLFFTPRPAAPPCKK